MSIVKEIIGCVINSLKLVKDVKILKETIEYRQAYPPLECQFCREVCNDVIVYHQHTFYVDDPESNNLLKWGSLFTIPYKISRVL